MDFDLSSTQKMMQQAARTFLTKECPTKRVRSFMAGDSACDSTLWHAMAEQGWLGIAVDEARGGLGLGAVELAAVAEEMGRACLPGPFISHVWATSLLAAAGGPSKNSPLPELCQGQKRATVALLEANPSWDPRAVQLRAEPVGRDLRLNGYKRLVPDVGGSDMLFCVARHGDDLVVIHVDSQAQGLHATRTPAIDETRKLYDVRFEGVPLPADAIICRGPAAEAALAESIAMATIAVSAELVGLMSWILETSVEYVSTRQQFGRTIGSFQAVQHQCVDMLLPLESARSATYYAAWTLATRQPGAAAAVSVAKAYASDAAREVANRGVQVHGGIGFTWEHDLQLYYKRAKSNEILLGDATYHRERVAKLVVEDEAKSLAGTLG